MNAAEAVARLDAIQNGDCEGAHSEADKVLLAVAGPEVKAAYERLVARCDWWACA